MSSPAPKTVRFTKIVERSGEPHVHTLWLAPEKDAELKRAQKEHRIMMLARSAPGGNTDIGTVGFDLEAARHGQVLIFPKSLKRFEGARVVGIKFDLVEQPKLASAAALKAAATAPAYRADRKRKPPPPELPGKEKPETEKAAIEPVEADSREHDRREIVPFDVPAAASKTEAKQERVLPTHAKPARESPRGKKPVAEKATTSTATKSSPTEAALVREIHAAMKELERGKSVAAYQRLQRAVATK